MSRKKRSQVDGQNSDEQTRRSLRPLMALKSYILKYPYPLTIAGIALVVSALAMLSVPIAARRMIDYGFSGQENSLISQYFAMLILIGVVLALASATRFYFVNWLGERVVADLRADVFAHLTTLGPAFFEKSHSGEMMSRLTADTTQIKAAAGTALSQVLRNAIMLIGALIMMMLTSLPLSLLVLIAIPAIVMPLMAYGRLVRRLSRQAQDSLAGASAYAAENLAAVRTLQAFVNEGVVAARFASAVEHAFDDARTRLLARAGLTALAMFLVIASVVGVLWYGASSVVSGDMTGGRLGQFVLYSLFAAGALAELSEVWGELSQAAGATERMSELLAIRPEIQVPENPLPLPTPPLGKIEFKDVRLAYPSRPDDDALKGISFSVAPGETVALVGPSGAGKSTIFNLLLRFYDPTQGEVRIDDINVAQADYHQVRRRVALVPQDIALFADTVAQNIGYGTPDAGKDAIAAAAHAAQAGEFINELPNGFETQLGERGVTLSGGQRQRIAIARAILKNAPILLLDEATSALDSESEAAVQKALEDVMNSRTTLVIAHRLATVLKADRILVLDDGKIVEEGSHEELSKSSGLYRRLADLQFNATNELAETG